MSDAGHEVRIAGNPAHSISKGFVCFRGKNFGQVHNSPERLTRPLLRQGSDWKEISFDDALDVLAANFLRVKENYGAQSAVFFKGEAVKHLEVALYMRHLANGFGSPNYISIGSLCHYSQVMAHTLTYGGVPHPDFRRIKVALIWGANPAVSYPRTFGEMRKALREGMKLVVIDPACTGTAKHAHMHLQVRPGSDGFLALAFSKYAAESAGMAPPPGTATGWEELADVVRGLSYSELLKQADISRAKFEDAASLIFRNLPGWSQAGLGLESTPGGLQAIRADQDTSQNLRRSPAGLPPNHPRLDRGQCKRVDRNRALRPHFGVPLDEGAAGQS